MIIRHPTGLYNLPEKPLDSGSVTFIVSNELPPRANLIFPKVPPGIVSRKRTLIPAEHRAAVGDLIFSVSRASRAQEGNNAKQYEIGEILAFGSGKIKSVQPMLVGQKTETRHDLNRSDYESLGFTEEEETLLKSASKRVHDNLSVKLNSLKRQRANAEVDINTQQKKIVEISRNVDALRIIAASSNEPEISELIEKLEVKRRAAQIILDKAIEDANNYATEADHITDELRAVAVVVK